MNVKIRIYRTTILPVVLHGCETWSLTFRVLRRILGPKGDEVTGGCRNRIRMIKSRRMRWAGHGA
jgi:hypothetical protein